MKKMPLTRNKPRPPKPLIVKMIKIIVVTSEGRHESTIKSPHATLSMRDAAYVAINALAGVEWHA